VNELSAVNVAEAALRLQHSSEAWLVEVAERFGAAWEHTRGIIAQEYQGTAEGGVQLLIDLQQGALSGSMSEAGLAALSQSQCDQVYGQGTHCMSASEVFPGGLPAPLAAQWGAMGVADVVGIFAREGDDRGMGVAAALAEPVRLLPRARARWMQVGQQLRLAARLQRDLRQRPLHETAHARFTPQGECLDARGTASQRSVRAYLRELVEALSRARDEATADDCSRVFSLWGALSRGEWILVDQFDGEHERHIIAAPCPNASPLRGLSAQQEAVARAAGRGLSNKEIAAELGLLERSVDNQLRRALVKLGLENRTALVRLWSSLERAGHAS
jgi:DNA-binding CsgD family transcriptional regulator